MTQNLIFKFAVVMNLHFLLFIFFGARETKLLAKRKDGLKPCFVDGSGEEYETSHL